MEEEQNKTRTPRHTRVAAINGFIREAERMSMEVRKERNALNDAAFEAASFSAAMNHLTAGQGLRVLTKSDRSYAELLYGPINA